MQQFTVEGWLRTATKAQFQIFAGRGGGASNWNSSTSWEWVVYMAQTTGRLTFDWNLNGTDATPQQLVGTSDMATSAFVHWALTFDGTTLRLFVGGAAEASTTSNVNMTKPSGANLFRIGGPVTGTASQSVLGHLDDVRITKGVARYTSNFTPPTAAFPNS